VFDGEAIGVWKGLQHTIRLPANVRHRRLWLCIDSTSVIWCLRGDAAVSSQWAFHLCQDAMQTHDIRIRWAPGHTGIEGNEAADKLADLGTHLPYDTGQASEPTASSIKSIFRGLRKEAQEAWWNKHNAMLSKYYEKWNLDYKVKLPPELDLPRPVLHRYLAIRSGHGDFSWYHKKFAHSNAKLTCSCGHAKDPRAPRTLSKDYPALWTMAPEATDSSVNSSRGHRVPNQSHGGTQGLRSVPQDHQVLLPDLHLTRATLSEILRRDS
jgi:hypothetical protein